MLQDFAAASVLVVDDEPADLARLGGFLTGDGLHNLHLEQDARRALCRLDTLAPDLVLLDLAMPRTDSLAVLDGLRRWAGGTYLPVVVLTSDRTAPALEAALARGATDFVTKPFNGTEIMLRVRNLLETGELHRTLHQHLGDADADLEREVGGRRGGPRSDVDTRERIGAVLSGGDLSTVFQPVVDLTDSAVVGYEALSRFAPGTPDTATWFSQAEGVGLATDLELAAAHHAVSQTPHLPQRGFVALNVSPATLVGGRLREVALDPGTLRGAPVVVELTEHVPVSDYDALAAAFAPLREAGALLALDDTGAGFAGLRHLLHLHPDIIKLDISLVTGIETDPARRALAAALVAFAEDIGAQVVAEGVETPAQAEALAGLGVRWGQGWLLGRPAPASAWR
ncbi:MAG: EAL domain-containing response regulator [Actinobacteria bacterium]|nr:EAL domain-containing response regulator [Actinomycetota bacterium]